MILHLAAADGVEFEGLDQLDHLHLRLIGPQGGKQLALFRFPGLHRRQLAEDTVAAPGFQRPAILPPAVP